MYSITEQNTTLSNDKTKNGSVNTNTKLKPTNTSFLHFHSPLHQTSSSLFCNECGCLHFFNPTMFSTVTSIKPYHLNYNIEIPPLDYFTSFQNKHSQNNYKSSSISDYLLNFRARIIKKYKYCTNKLKLSFHTMYNALNIVDKVLFNNKIYSNSKLEKIGLGALILSIKFNELVYNYQNLKYIQSVYEISNAILTASQIKKLELSILKKINYDIISDSFLVIINYFLLNGVLFNCDKGNNSTSKEDVSKTKQSLSMLTRKIAITILERNVQYMEYNQFHLACAVIAFTRNQLRLEKWPQCVFEFIYKVNEKDFEKEYNFVQRIYKMNNLIPSISNSDIIFYKQLSTNKGRNCKRLKPNNNIINNKLKSILSNNSVINSTILSPKKIQRFPILRSISKNEDTFRYPSSNSNITTNQSSVSTLCSCPRINRIASQSQSIDVTYHNNNQSIDLKSSFQTVLNNNNNKQINVTGFDSSLSKYNNSNFNKQIILTDISDVSLYQRKKISQYINTDSTKNKSICHTTTNSQKDNNQKQEKVEFISTYKQKTKTSFNMYNKYKYSNSFITKGSFIRKHINTSFNKSFNNVDNIHNQSKINNKKKLLNNSFDLNITFQHTLNSKNNHSMEKKNNLTKKKVNAIEELIIKKVLQCKKLTSAIEKTIFNSFNKNKQNNKHFNTKINKSSVINKITNNHNNKRKILMNKTNCSLSSETLGLKSDVSMKSISNKGISSNTKYFKTKSIHQKTKVTKSQIKQLQS